MGTCFSCPCASREDTTTDAPSASASDAPEGQKYACLDPEYWKLTADYLWEQRNIAFCYFCDTFDWYAFAYVEVDIAQAIFQGNNTFTWMVWSIPFFTAPIGATIIGRLADHVGRKPAYTMGASLFIAGTFGQALTPTYSFVGPLWLITCRFLQGLGFGSKFSISCVYLAEMAPKRVLAMSRAGMNLASPLAYLVLGICVMPLYALLDTNQMLIWGWRLPFIIASVGCSIPLFFFHTDAAETKEFEKVQEEREEAQEEPMGTLEMVQQTWLSGIVAMAGLMLDCATHGLGENYINSWLVTWCGYSQLHATSLICGAQLLTIPSIFVALSLADTFGCGTVGLGVAAYGAALALPLYSLPYYYPGNPAVDFGVIVTLNGMMYGVRSIYVAWVSDVFPTKVRGQATGLYMNLAFISEGLAPAICSTAPLLAGYWWLTCAIVTFGAFGYSKVSHQMLKNGGTEDDGWLKVAYLRDEPY